MIENTNIKQFYPGPILNNTLEITDFLFNDVTQVKIKHTKFDTEGNLRDIDLEYPTDYEVAKILSSNIDTQEAALTASVGQITLKNIEVKAGEKLTAYRVSPIIQDKDYPRAGAFPAATHEGALDYLTMQNQEQKDELDRALKVPVSTQGFEGSMPAPLPGRALKINNTATGFELSEFDPDTALITTENFKNESKQYAEQSVAAAEQAVDSATYVAETTKDFTELAADYTSQISVMGDTIIRNADSIINRIGLNMFDPVMKDHVLTFEESKGLVAFGDYAYKTGSAGTRYGYPEFYDKCIQEYNNCNTHIIHNIDNAYNKVGNVAINGDYEVTNITTDNYLTSKQSFDLALSYNWEFSVRIKLSSLALCYLFGGNVENKYQILFGVDADGKLVYSLSDNGTSWNLANNVTGSSTLNLHTWYDVSIGRKSNTIYMNINGVKDISTKYPAGTTGTTLFHQITSPFKIGNGWSANPSSNVIIDLKNTSFTIDDIVYNSNVDVKRNDNGHLFYDLNSTEQVNAIENMYKLTGMAWLYGVDTIKERIRIVRNDRYFMCGNAGEMVHAGLPNIEGSISNIRGPSEEAYSGAFMCTKTGRYSYDGYSSSGNSHVTSTAFKASNCVPVYGNSDTVQTDAVKLVGYICVGNTEIKVVNTEVTEVTTTENDTVPLFTGQYFDFKPNNISWLAKDTVQSKSGKFYETTYNELVKCLNEVDNVYNIKVIDIANMIEGVDYSLYWKVDQANMTFTTPSKWGLVSALTGTQRVLVAKKEPTETDSTWYNLYSDGWLEQGGQLIGSMNTLVFSIPYRDTNYNIQISASDVSPTDYALCVNSWNDKTNSSVTLYCAYNGKVQDTSPYDWVTTGYTQIPNVEDYTEDVYLYFKVGNAVANKELINVGALTEVVNNKIDINSGYIDGQWVSKELILLDVSTTTGDLDLSTYLPNDSLNYEVMFSYLYQAGSSSGVHNYISSDIVPSEMEIAFLSTSTTTTSAGIFSIPIGTQRKVTLVGASKKTLKATAYRRIGLNQ